MKYLKAAVEWAKEANEIAVDYLADRLSWLAVALVALAATTTGIFIATHPKPKGPQIIASGGMGGFAAPYTVPSQLNFVANGTGAVSRKVANKLGDWVSTADFSGADFCARLTAAIAAVGSGGVIHAEGDDPAGGGGWTCASGVTISTPGITIYLPSAQINMGTNQWTITAGTHNVTLIGASSFGVASVSTTTGTSIQYTGTGAAIVVGDSSQYTYGFLMQDVAVAINAAGTAAIGIQLNQAARYQLYRQRIELLIAANTQKGIDLEGFNNFTGGVIYHPWISNGGTAIYFGKNANFNTVISGDFPMTATGTGIAFNFAGAVGGLADGNFIFGADAESCLRPLNFDYASNNQIFGLRTEACTTIFNATANSIQNLAWVNGTTPFGTDSGTANSFMTNANPVFSQSFWRLRNQIDAQSELLLQSGLTTGQNVLLTFRKWDGNNQWQFIKDTSENFYLQHSTSGVNAFMRFGNNLYLNAEGVGAVLVNSSASTGTGGLEVWNGAASPAKVAGIDSGGAISTTSTKTKGTCTLNGGTPATCTATVLSGATCIAVPQGTTAAAATHTLAVSVTTTTLTVTGANGLTDAVNYWCGG